jgi:hypothetical protein
MGYLIGILIGAFGGLVAAEAHVYAHPVARWLIRMAAARLPADERESAARKSGSPI